MKFNILMSVAAGAALAFTACKSDSTDGAKGGDLTTDGASADAQTISLKVEGMT